MKLTLTHQLNEAKQSASLDIYHLTLQDRNLH